MIQAKKYGYRASHISSANRLALFLCILHDISNLTNRLRVIFHSPVPCFGCVFQCCFFFCTITTFWTRNTVGSLIALKMTIWYYSTMIIAAFFTRHQGVWFKNSNISHLPSVLRIYAYSIPNLLVDPMFFLLDR